MYKLITFLNHCMTGLTLLTALGVFVHDGRVDKAAVNVVYGASSTVEGGASLTQRYQEFISSDAHTHPDHNALRASLLNNFAYQSPSVPPRGQEHKKHLLDELRFRGHHAFDNALLPIVS